MAGFVAVGGVAVGAFAGGFVHAVEDAAAQAPAGQTETSGQVIHRTCENDSSQFRGFSE
jgi:hypothetical protein